MLERKSKCDVPSTTVLFKRPPPPTQVLVSYTPSPDEVDDDELHAMVAVNY